MKNHMLKCLHNICSRKDYSLHFTLQFNKVFISKSEVIGRCGEDGKMNEHAEPTQDKQ